MLLSLEQDPPVTPSFTAPGYPKTATFEVQPEHCITSSGSGGQRDIPTNTLTPDGKPYPDPVPATQSVPGYLAVPSSPTLKRTPPLSPLPLYHHYPVRALVCSLAGRSRLYPASLSPKYPSSTSTISHPEYLIPSSVFQEQKGQVLSRSVKSARFCEEHHIYPIDLS